MKKALSVTFGTMIAACLTVPVYGHVMQNGIIRHSAVSITGTYTETSNNGVSMGDYILSLPSSSGEPLGRRPIFIDCEGHFDYALGYTYHIPATPSYFFLSYDHYSAGDDFNAVGLVVNLGLHPVGFSADTLKGQIDDFGRVDQHSDEFRIGFLHQLNFGTRFDLGLSTFLEWNDVKRSMYEDVSIIGSTDLVVGRASQNEMEGWGFGVGALAHAKPFRNLRWGVFVDAKTTLIWADNEFSESLINERSPESTSLNQVNYFFDPESSVSVVPKVDIKFGVDYCLVFNSDIGRMFVETALGMRYMNMFNAFKNGNTFYNPFWNPGSAFQARTSAANLGPANDWGRVGPFLTFRVGGADA